jgi:hypothetical protein
MTKELKNTPAPAPSYLSRFVNGVREMANQIAGRARKTASTFLARGNEYPKDEYFRITNRRGKKLSLTLKDFDQNAKKAGKKKNDAGILLPARDLKKNESDTKGGVIVVDGDHLNESGGQRLINKYIEKELISFSELGIEVDANYRLTNLTPKRIGIQNYKYHELLIIPPFGVRILNSEILKTYFFESWKSQNLISVEKEVSETNQVALFTFGLLVIILGILVLVGLPTAWFFEDVLNITTVGIACAVTLGLLLVNFLAINGGNGTGDAKQWGSTLWDWLKLSPGIALVALTGFGLPLWIIFSWGGGSAILNDVGSGNFTLLALGRLVQVGFICMASILPALFYYLFGRQQVAKLREKFFRDVMILDPHLYTLSEAETKYNTLLNSAYGSSSANSPFAILLLIFSTAILVIGWVTAIAPYSQVPADATNLMDFFNIRATPFTLGILGAYFFSINMIFRRYVRADLTPKTYAYITVRLLITLVLVWAVSTLPDLFGDGSFVQSGILAVAFIIGIFPDTGLALIKSFVRKATGARFVDDTLPLTDLEGMNLYDQARLLEEGIENIENLAHHNFVELLAFTRIPTPRLVDMFDQAILYLHINDGLNDQKDEEPSTKNNPDKERNIFLNHLKTYGIRTATDLLEAIEKFDDKRDETPKPPETLEIERLRIIRETLKDDEWLGYIQTWKKETANPSFADNPYTFYDGSARRPSTKEDASKSRKENESAAKSVEQKPAPSTTPAIEVPPLKG